MDVSNAKRSRSSNHEVLTCARPGCERARFREPNGRPHDFCSRTHANEAMQMAIQMSLEWSCTQCTLYNPGGCAACEACGSPAPKSAAVDLLAEGAGENAHPCMPTPAPAAMEQLIAGQLERQNQRQRGLRPSIAELEVSGLSFAVRYELEVLLCAGAIARNALCTGFLERLACCTIGLATRALRMMAVGGGECSDPLSAFEQCISASTAKHPC